MEINKHNTEKKETVFEELPNGDFHHKDLSEGQFNTLIKRDEERLSKMEISEYDLKEIESCKRTIKNQKLEIKNKTEEYKRNLKINKDYIKQYQGRMARLQENIKQDNDHKDYFTIQLKALKGIKDYFINKKEEDTN